MKAKRATQIVGGNPSQKRAEADFYPTPPDVTEALLGYLDLPEGTTVLEPACGEMDMAKVIKDGGYNVIATDLKYGQDFLTMEIPECDWIITNPPFTLADQFIRRCAESGKPFALLLKSQYWHAKKRYNIFYEFRPSAICPLTWRPDFLFKQHNKKSAPLMDVMWCIWEKPYSTITTYYPLRRE